jgi:uncharacterized protein (DUF302 family)
MFEIHKPLAMLTIAGLLVAGPALADQGIERLTSDHSIDEVDQRLRAALEARGMNLVTVVDHAANAESVELSLPPTRTFVFGNPQVGTPMMQCQGSVALDLPQKLLIRETDEGTRLEWNHPDYLAQRHDLSACDLPLDDVAEALSGIAAEAAGP